MFQFHFLDHRFPVTCRTVFPFLSLTDSAKLNLVQIRTLLHIPTEAETVFERYSDSASSFVQLTPGNIPVYKQLYRAAKAKSKLKIRVSLREPAEQVTPKPVSVEDEPEVSSSSPAPETPSEEKSQEMSQEIKDEVSPAPTPASVAPAKLPPLFMPELGSGFTASNIFGESPHKEGLKEAARLGFDRPFPQFNAPYRPRPVAHEWNNWSTTLPAGRLPSVCPSMCPATGPNFAVCCNNCEKTIPDMHYHCSTCDDGDFDLCQTCVEAGVSCYSGDHWLIKRTTRNGVLVQSTTETIAPKVKQETEESKPEAVVQTPKEVEAEPKVEAKEEPKEEVKQEDEEVKEEPKIKFETKPIVDVLALPKPTFEPLVTRWATLTSMRTCNCCVQGKTPIDYHMSI